LQDGASTMLIANS